VQRLYYKGGSYEFEDLKSLTGFQYVYRVAAYDTGHPNWNNTGTSVRSLEGGNSSPEQWANGVLANSPFFPANAAADQMQRKISIVPNPYKVDGSHAYPQLGLMRFTNLPRKAKIRIFTVAGEFVADFEHNDPSKAEAGWTQVPLFRGGTASAGLYYWVVESLVPESQGRTQSGTLMIIK